MKLPTWNWSEARKQFEMRIPGLVNTRRALLEKVKEAGHAWRRDIRKA